MISGPSGVGKTTITRGVESRFDDAVFSVSCTTRPKSEKDREGVDYRFVTPDAFRQMVADDQMLESAEVYGNFYGTPRGPIDEALSAGKLVLVEIDVQGAKQVKEKMPGAFGVFVLPPSDEALLERLRGRGREGEDVIQRRFQRAQDEIAAARASGVYDLFVVNDELERALGEVVGAVEEQRVR
ncbi:MAG: guanylate kinase [Planctomycetota bacterium]